MSVGIMKGKVPKHLQRRWGGLQSHIFVCSIAGPYMKKFPMTLPKNNPPSHPSSPPTQMQRKLYNILFPKISWILTVLESLGEFFNYIFQHLVKNVFFD